MLCNNRKGKAVNAVFLGLFGFGEKEKPKIDKSIPEMDDSELVETIVGGDADAFTELVKRYEKLVYSTAYFSVKNSDDAWDISQEVFMRVYNSISSFRGESKFATWLYRLCKNVTYDYMRKHYAHKEIMLSELSGDDDDRPFEIPDESILSDPEKSVVRREEIEAVRAAVKKLDENSRAVIVLREFEGYSYSEMAVILGLEEGTVKSRLNRARSTLKKLLYESGAV